MIAARFPRKARSMRIENSVKSCVLFVVTVMMISCSVGRSEHQSSAVLKADSSNHKVIAEQPSSTNQGIRSVDFANFTYPWVSDLGDPKQSFTLQNGEYAGGRDEEPMSMRRVVYGDVTSDGTEEAMIILSVVVTGGTARPHVVYIYTLHEHPKLLWAFSTGDRADGGLRQVYAENGKLVVELYGKSRIIGRESNNIEDQFGVCCPKFFTRARYEWQGTRFQQNGTEETLPNPEGHGSPLISSY